MPYHNRDPKRDPNFDNHPYVDTCVSVDSARPVSSAILRPKCTFFFRLSNPEGKPYYIYIYMYLYVFICVYIYIYAGQSTYVGATFGPQYLAYNLLYECMGPLGYHFFRSSTHRDSPKQYPRFQHYKPYPKPRNRRAESETLIPTPSRPYPTL